MNNERTAASPPTNIGISLLLSVFLILCLFTFSAIALVQAQNEWDNAVITRDNRAAYYAAANEAEQSLYVLNRSLDPGSRLEPRIAEQYPISDSQALSVVMTLVREGNRAYYRFSEFQTVSTKTWEGDDSVNVIR